MSYDKPKFGAIDASIFKLAIVQARWNSHITDALSEGAFEALGEYGVRREAVHFSSVSGSFELPVVCRELAISGQFQGVIALGALIKGETDHYHYVADAVAKGLMDISIQTGVPVAFGVITAQTVKLATERAGGCDGNKGFEAAVSVLEAIAALGEIVSGSQ